ncbi:MAG: DUF1569 domain-containing protein [Pirellulaceae bacterium]
MAEVKDSAKVSNFRSLRFQSIQELLNELDRIEAAENSGNLKTEGNWSSGQILAHISNWVDYGWNGYPIGAPPFFLRWLMRMMGRRMIKKGMMRGVKIPKVPGGTVGKDDVSMDEGLKRIRKSFERLQAGELSTHDSPAFGPMSHEDRIQLNLRHAELHLGFLNY